MERSDWQIVLTAEWPRLTQPGTTAQSSRELVSIALVPQGFEKNPRTNAPVKAMLEIDEMAPAVQLASLPNLIRQTRRINTHARWRRSSGANLRKQRPAQRAQR
ncbi:MAG TPA: hypothetical protein VMV99_11330 [Rhodanobacter sp.]|nr:hypothetical protein [Rhodanobacter sp.]